MYVQSVHPIRFSIVFPPLLWALQYPVLKGVALRISSPVFLPGESHGWRSLVGYSLQGCKEVDTTEWLSRHSSSLYSCFIDISLELPLYPRAGNNPLSFVSNTVPWTLDTGFKTSRLVPLIKIVPDSNSQPLIMNYGISQMNSSNFQFICAFAFLLSTAFQDQKC